MILEHPESGIITGNRTLHQDLRFQLESCLFLILLTMMVSSMTATMTTQPFIILACHSCPVDFINFQDNSEVAHTKSSVFTQAQLLTITLEQLWQWLNKKVYQILKPRASQHDNSRSSTNAELCQEVNPFLFTPNKLTLWDVATCTGNPIKAVSLECPHV